MYFVLRVRNTPLFMWTFCILGMILSVAENLDDLAKEGAKNVKQTGVRVSKVGWETMFAQFFHLIFRFCLKM